MKYVDIGVSVLFITALVVIYFFWGCHLDLYVTVLAAIVIAVTGLTTYMQYKKLKDLEGEENKEVQWLFSKEEHTSASPFYVCDEIELNSKFDFNMRLLYNKYNIA